MHGHPDRGQVDAEQVGLLTGPADSPAAGPDRVKDRPALVVLCGPVAHARTPQSGHCGACGHPSAERPVYVSEETERGLESNRAGTVPLPSLPRERRRARTRGGSPAKQPADADGLGDRSMKLDLVEPLSADSTRGVGNGRRLCDGRVAALRDQDMWVGSPLARVAGDEAAPARLHPGQGEDGPAGVRGSGLHAASRCPGLVRWTIRNAGGMTTPSEWASRARGKTCSAGRGSWRRRPGSARTGLPLP